LESRKMKKGLDEVVVKASVDFGIERVIEMVME
jgi:hypothetical protein